jgi:hypothetical protein
MIVDADGEWLDLAVVDMLVWPGPARRSSRSVRLIGADLDAVPTSFGPDGSVPGKATITGIWLGDAIEVRSQSAAGRPLPAAPQWTVPPCPPPAGGWPRATPYGSLEFDLGDLTATGAAVTVTTFRPSAEQTVLVVAAGDIDAVTAVLLPQLPGQLCVVPSRWTRAQLDAVRAHFDRRGGDLALDIWGERTDERGQSSVEVQLLRVTARLADWADTLPEGLLTLVPSLTPAAPQPTGHQAC